MKWSFFKKITFSNSIGYISASVFILTLAFFSYRYYQIQIKEEQKELSVSLSNVEFLIQSEFNVYFHGLQALSGFLRTESFQPSEKKLKSYYESLNRFSDYEGALGMGFIRAVKSEEFGNYVKKMQKINPGFSIKRVPDGDGIAGQMHFIVESILPLDPNHSAIGLDVSSGSRRRKAAIESAQKGEPILSERIRLVQLSNNDPAFLFYFPVYRNPQVPSDPEKRMSELVGWTYAPIIAEQVYQNFVNKLNRRLALKIVEINENGQNLELYQTLIPKNRKILDNLIDSRLVQIYGRKWLISGSLTKDASQLDAKYSMLLFFIIGSEAIIFATFFIKRRIDKKRQLIKRDQMFFRSFYKNTANGMLIFDSKKMVFTQCNAAAARMLGIKEEDLMGKSPLDFSPEVQHDGVKSLDKMQTIVGKIVSDGTHRFEWEFKDVQGNFIFADIIASSLKMNGEDVFLIDWRDLTQIKNAEKKLIEVSSWQKAILEASEYGIVSITMDGMVSTANKAASQILGYQPEDLIGKMTPADFHDPEQIYEVAKSLLPAEQIHLPTKFDFELVKRVVLSQPNRGEWRYVRKDGSKFDVQLSVSPIFDESKNMIGFLGMFQDLTKIKTIESELKQIHSAIQKSAIVAMTDENGKIIEVNDNFCKISGFSREELIGQDHRIINSKFHPKSFFKKLWSTISSGNIWMGEIRNRTKNGQYYWVQTVITPLYDLNLKKITRYLSIRFDITERKLAEEKLIQSAKMATLGEMAGGIAHEINNPLAIINGKSAQLTRMLDRDELDPQKIKEGLNIIESTSNRIAKIVKGLRSFSRNSEKDPMVPTSIKRIVEDSVELCKERFRFHSVDLKIKVDLDVEVECRVSQISQVIMNLLNNAFDAIESLPEKWVQLEVIPTDSEVKISVTDSGNGITSEVLEKIMQPFFTTKEVGKGTGLGLSISKGITEEHHGSLEYDSTSPHTRFIMRLPRKQPISG